MNGGAMTNNVDRRRAEGSVIQEFLLTGRAPTLGFFEYEFRIHAQKLDEVDHTTSNTKAVFNSLATLRRDLHDKMGPGWYRLQVFYRSPYEPGWETVKIESYEVGSLAEIKK